MNREARASASHRRNHLRTERAGHHPSPRSSALGLEPKRVEEWMRTYAATGDRSVRNAMLEHLVPLADYYAARYERRTAPREDLRQVALLAVLRAADRYDPNNGALFTTFASRTIEGELKRYLRDKTWAVRPPRPAQELYLSVRSTQDELTQLLGRGPTVEEIARRMQEPIEAVIEALDIRWVQHAGSLEQQREDGNGDASPSHADLLAFDDHSYGTIEQRVMLSGLIDALSDTERTIVRLHFYEGKTQQEIAAVLGISQSYLSRLLRRLLDDLRERMPLEPIPA